MRTWNVPSGLCVSSSSFSSPASSSTRSLRLWPSSPAPGSVLPPTLRITVPSNLNLKLTVTPCENALVSVGLKSEKSNLVIKPRLPSEKLITGGTMPWNSQLAYSTVPSPPSVMMKSKACGFVRHNSASQYRSWRATLSRAAPGSTLFLVAYSSAATAIRPSASNSLSSRSRSSTYTVSRRSLSEDSNHFTTSFVMGTKAPS